MSKDVNKFLVSGRLGRDPQLRQTQQGQLVANLSLANSRSVRQPDGSYVKQTEWFKIIAWDRLAQTCASYLKKGSPVLFEGRLEISNYQDRQGQTRQKIEVIASDMVMLGSQSRQEEGQEAEENPFNQPEVVDPTQLEGEQDAANGVEDYESEEAVATVEPSVSKPTQMEDPWESFSALPSGELEPVQAEVEANANKMAEATHQTITPITPAQLSKIRELAQAKGYSFRAVQTSTQKLFQVALEQLTSPQAAEVMERLERLKEIELIKAA